MSDIRIRFNRPVFNLTEQAIRGYCTANALTMQSYEAGASWLEVKVAEALTPEQKSALVSGFNSYLDTRQATLAGEGETFNMK